jgi:Phage Tail Collar Domain
MSTFTPNLQLEEVARGGDVGTWDTPTNSNWSIVDLAVGGLTSIGLNNSNVVLSAAQFQCNTIAFAGTLTASVNITFPTSFVKSYNIYNTCGGSSAFTINMNSTGLSQSICAVPGETVTIWNDGSGSLRYIGLGRVGSYVDFGGSSVPNWVNACTIPPYLPCDGTSFSSATYPILTAVLGGTTLPDRRGTVGATLNAGTNRITSGISGIDGNTRFSQGGNQLLQQHTHTATTGGMSANTVHAHTANAATIGIVLGGGGPGQAWAQAGASQGATFNTDNSPSIDHTHAVTVQNAGSGLSQNMPPTTIYGITMIRAA